MAARGQEHWKTHYATTQCFHAALSLLVVLWLTTSRAAAGPEAAPPPPGESASWDTREPRREAATRLPRWTRRPPWPQWGGEEGRTAPSLWAEHHGKTHHLMSKSLWPFNRFYKLNVINSAGWLTGDVGGHKDTGETEALTDTQRHRHDRAFWKAYRRPRQAGQDESQEEATATTQPENTQDAKTHQGLGFLPTTDAVLKVGDVKHHQWLCVWN